MLEMVSHERHEALGSLFRALALLRSETPAENPAAFALLAEGPLREIERIQTDIDSYIGADIAGAPNEGDHKI